MGAIIMRWIVYIVFANLGMLKIKFSMYQWELVLLKRKQDEFLKYKQGTMVGFEITHTGTLSEYNFALFTHQINFPNSEAIQTERFWYKRSC